MRTTKLPWPALLLFLLPSCAFHSTATHWNGRVGPNGRPVLYAGTTKVGANVLIAVPFLGRLSIDGQVDTLTRKLAEEGGDHIRIVQGGTENYWYGFPPLTWIVTPVVTSIYVEFEPTDEMLRSILREQLVEEHGDELGDDELDRLVDEELRRFER